MVYGRFFLSTFFFHVVFFKQKTAYEMCGRDWSSDVCSSDLLHLNSPLPQLPSASQLLGAVLSSATSSFSHTGYFCDSVSFCLDIGEIYHCTYRCRHSSSNKILYHYKHYKQNHRHLENRFMLHLHRAVRAARAHFQLYQLHSSMADRAEV